MRCKNLNFVYLRTIHASIIVLYYSLHYIWTSSYMLICPKLRTQPNQFCTCMKQTKKINMAEIMPSGSQTGFFFFADALI